MSSDRERNSCLEAWSNIISQRKCPWWCLYGSAEERVVGNAMNDPKASLTGNKTQFAKMKDVNTNEENNGMKEKERKRRKKELQ